MRQPDLTETERLRRLYTRRVAERGTGRGPCVAPEAILAVIRREGGEGERLAALEHVMSCAACHREYRWLTAVDRAAGEAGGDAGAASRPWWRSAPLALAASLAAAITAGVLVRQVVHEGADPVRGTEGGIALVAPPAIAAAGAPLTFVWRTVPGVSRYVLEVQRGGAVVFADTTADTTVTLRDPALLLPASDYRWWVREISGDGVPRSSTFRRLRLAPR